MTKTVAELMALLKGQPQEMEVWVVCEGGFVKEGVTAIRGIVDNHLELDTTGNAETHQTQQP